MSDRLHTALGTAGVVTTLLGVLAVTAPRIVAGTEPLATVARTLSDVGLSRLLLAGCVAAGLVVVRLAWRSGGEREPAVGDPAAAFDGLLDAPPEAVTVETATPTAAGLDSAIARAVAGDSVAMAGVRDRLAAVATDRLVRHRGYDPPAAEEAVAAGTWTNDRVVAAFLAESGGPVYSLGSRLRLWLDPETERRRRFERTVGAIEALDDGVGRPGRPVSQVAAGNTEAGGSARERGQVDRTRSTPRGGEQR